MGRCDDQVEMPVSGPGSPDVDEAGRVLAIEPGETTIHGTFGGASDSFSVRVIPPVLDPVVEAVEPGASCPLPIPVTTGQVASGAEAEEGTELYILHNDAADENVLWMYELYTDGDALAVHGGSETMAELLAKMGEFAEATEMSFVSPVAAAGHPL